MFESTIGVVIATSIAHMLPRVIAITKVPTMSNVRNL
jgi:hypothetical protein